MKKTILFFISLFFLGVSLFLPTSIFSSNVIGYVFCIISLMAGLLFYSLMLVVKSGNLADNLIQKSQTSSKEDVYLRDFLSISVAVCWFIIVVIGLILIRNNFDNTNLDLIKGCYTTLIKVFAAVVLFSQVIFIIGSEMKKE